MMKFTFDNPTKLLFGSGSIENLHKEAMPGKKALLLMSTGKSAYRSGAYDKVVAQLDKAGVSHIDFNGIMENPLMEACEEGGKIAKENGCDMIVALGGGAVLDAAVGVSVMATNPGRLWDYVQVGTGKRQRFENDPLPVITIPTSSGTGSEMNEWGVICREDTNEKIGFGDRRCKPVLAVVDPTFMITVPPHYTAYQGMDALFHSTEAMMSMKLNVMTEAIALSAIENIAKYLPRAVKDGTDLEAREHVAYGSTMAGLTMQLTGTTAQHSLEHAMSAYHRNLPHGAGLIMICQEFAKYVIEKHLCDESFIKMAKVMGMENASRPEDFLTAQEELMKACNVNDLKMSDYGFVGDKEDCMKLAVNAREKRGVSNPCEMTDEEVAGIFARSFR